MAAASKSRSIAIAILVVALVAAAAAVVLPLALRFLPLAFGPGEPASECWPAGLTSAAETEFPRELKVVEKGAFLDENPPDLNVGAVIENTGTKAAYDTVVEYTVMVNGTTVTSGSQLRTQVVPAILPGQKLPIGATLYSDNRIEGFGAVFAMVDVKSTHWVDPAPESPLFQPPTTTPIESSDDQQLNYTIDSAGCGDLIERGTAAVLRDAEGRIIGGAFQVGNTVERERCSATTATQTVVIPNNTVYDYAKSQVTVFCDAAERDGPTMN